MRLPHLKNEFKGIIQYACKIYKYTFPHNVFYKRKVHASKFPCFTITKCRSRTKLVQGTFFENGFRKKEAILPPVPSALR